MTEQSIFIAALELSPEQRKSFLDEACAGDLELRQRVGKLLAFHEKANDFMAVPAGQFAVTNLQTSLLEQSGHLIGGRYKLLEQIGEGGMGTVWVADQIEPIRRRVAVKLIKPGMDSRQVIARFEAERQALALMDHPNIAKVLDGGTTELGRPFFVMEYVKGTPITTYCDDVRLTVPERLDLFSQVCQAVQHAHQKGIIHRDLKPSNILVCQYDGRPVPKVIDFGLAKAMHQPLTDHTLYTGHGVMLGTPLYMSPEQAESNNLDIDTRADIYSLGVILYELLTGSTPLEKLQFKNAAFQEILRLIKEEEPQKPSTKISGSAFLPNVAAQRRLDPAQLDQMVRGDLDWIVMKSIEKDRANRYETANGLAKDVQRYLMDLPVEACPPSRNYRLRKFARRNRAAIMTAGLVLGALILGTVVSTWQAVRATLAENAAETARFDEANQRILAETQRAEAVQQKGEAETQRAEAVRQRAQAEANFQKARVAVDEYFTIVSESKLLNVPGLEPLRMDLLEAALRFYRDFADERTSDAAVQADVAVTWMRVAEIYHSLGRNDDAISAVAHSQKVIDRLLHDNPSAHAEHCKLAGFWKGWRRTQQWTAIPKDPQAAFQTILRLMETWTRLSDENPSVVAFQSDLAAINAHIGELLTSVQKPAEGIPFLLRAQGLLETLIRENPGVPQFRSDLSQTCYQLAWHLPSLGQVQDAQTAWRKSLSIGEQLVLEFPNNPLYRDELASKLIPFAARFKDTQPEESDKALHRALSLREHLVGVFPATRQYRARLYGLNIFCGALLDKREPTEAEQARHRAAELLNEWDQASDDLPERQTMCEMLLTELTTVAMCDQPYEAFTIGRHVVEMNERWVSEYPDIVSYTELLGQSARTVAGHQSKRHIWGDAETNLRKAVAAFTKLAADDPDKKSHHNHLAEASNALGIELVRKGQLRDAETCFRLAIANDPALAEPQDKLLEIATQKTKIGETAAAERYALEHDWDRIVSEYSKLITPESKNVQLLAKRAQAYEKLEKWDFALADWTRASQLQPDVAFDRFKSVDGASFRFDLNSGGTGSMEVMDGTLVFTTTSTTGVDWHVQAFQALLQLENGEEYVIRFKMKSPDSCRVTLVAGIDQEDWHSIGLNETLDPPPEFKDYEFTFVAHDVVRGKNRIGLQLGRDSGKVLMREIVILKKRDVETVRDVESVTKQAAAYVSQGDWGLALAEWRRAVAQQPNQMKNAFDQFLKAHRWIEAADFGLQLIQQNRSDSMTWLRVAPVMALADDQAAYSEFCGRMVQQFVSSKLPVDLERVVKSTLLRANSIDLAELPGAELAKLLDDGTEPEAFLPWGWAARAVLAYRSREFESTVKYVAKSEAHNPHLMTHALNLTILAIAEHQLRHSLEAKVAFEEASKVLKRLQDDEGNNGEHDLLIAEILFREANSLINGTKQP